MELAHGAPGGREEHVDLRWHDCAYDLAVHWAARCGLATLEGDAEVVLPFVIMQYDQASPSPSAVLYLEGGPGIAAGMDHMDFAWDRWLESAVLPLDFVAYDSRGTGVAWPSAGCHELREVTRPALAAGWFSQESWALISKAKAACLRRLITEGHDLSQYTTQRLAMDAIALMDALPYDEWTLFGTSYGTLLAQEILRMRPEAIQSIVLDGAVPPGADSWAAHPAHLEDALAKIARVCPHGRMGGPNCLRYAGDFLASLDILLDELERTPRWIHADDWFPTNPLYVRVDPTVVLYALFSAMYAPDGANIARNAILEARLGNDENLDQLVQSWANGIALSRIHWPVFFSASCHLSEGHPDDRPWEALPESSFFRRYVADTPLPHPCDHWKRNGEPELVRDPVVSTVPALIYSGEYDPVTPSHWGARVAADFVNSSHFIVPRGGHVALFDDRCAMRILRAFLAEPTVEFEWTCMQERPYGVQP